LRRLDGSGRDGRRRKGLARFFRDEATSPRLDLGGNNGKRRDCRRKDDA